MDREETPNGTLITLENISIFLGNRNASLNNLITQFPHFRFLRLKQTHSDKIINSCKSTPDYAIEGDAHITEETGLALCSISADCIPILVVSSCRQHIAAIHAGWRGLAARIVPKTISELHKIIPPGATLSFYIGPHIQQESFEVGKDVEHQILASVSSVEPNMVEKLSPEKSKIDLQAILLSQIKEFEIPKQQVFYHYIDTFKDSNYHWAAEIKAIPDDKSVSYQ